MRSEIRSIWAAMNDHNDERMESKPVSPPASEQMLSEAEIEKAKQREMRLKKKLEDLRTADPFVYPTF